MKMQPHGRSRGRFRLLIDAARDLTKVRTRLSEAEGMNSLSQAGQQEYARLIEMVNEAITCAYALADTELPGQRTFMSDSDTDT